MTPNATIFAGVNGAGKTTAYFDFALLGLNLGARINVDEIASSIGDHKDRATQAKAARIALIMRKMYIKDRCDFNLETTLCGHGILRLFSELKKEKFFISLCYVGLESLELAKERVKIRVSKGGHDIKPQIIEKRYYESLENLAKIMPLCDEIKIYDNSQNLSLIGHIKNFRILKFQKTNWLKELNLKDKI